MTTGRIIGLIFLVGAAIYALQLAIVAVLIVGLVFRTKTTIALMALLALFAHPLIGGAILAVLIAISLFLKNKENKEKAFLLAIDDPDQE